MDLVSNSTCDSTSTRKLILNRQSLALALYFASRGVGQVRPTPEDDAVPYTSPARVLINGLGSDELLGGYGRHRTAFNIGGWASVIEEASNLVCLILIMLNPTEFHSCNLKSTAYQIVTSVGTIE